eukprot:TRINITY_DN61973_c0_g1_i1.p1 TRINITY_DN61973_c0_g1~~TRINITY_DN61973_c0_g1_i1.p1  ORF type:complete len:185 (+),score=16.59 TRINITY_DN61973_c0_g1_i1:57-611(+)
MCIRDRWYQRRVRGLERGMRVSEKPVIVWFRQDLRLSDNPALATAVATGAPVIPLFVLDEETPGQCAHGGASRWWLHESLTALQHSLQQQGASLVLRRGNAAEIIRSFAAETEARAVLWNRCYEPYAIQRDKALKSALKDDGIEVESFNAGLLFEPWEVKTKSGTPPKVYSPCLLYTSPSPRDS